METQTEKQRPAHGQLISVPHKDTVRLLEVYIKRSVSLNESTVRQSQAEREKKWVTLPKKQRRSSSDPYLHLNDVSNYGKIGASAVADLPTNQPERLPEESKKATKKSKKSKKPSFWKNMLGFFSRKSDEDKDEDTHTDVFDGSDTVSADRSTTPVTLQKKPSSKKSLRRKFSKRRLSLIKPNKPGKSPDITGVEGVICVEPTNSYYEKVSEELERIVHEVKVNEETETLSDEEVINRIIALTKEQGDAIDDKLKDNPTLSSFFQQISYSSFQKLADAYLEKEVAPTHNSPTVLPTAPELVKLAFTLDFTARIAGLSRQNICHITGLGNRYLLDRFQYMQACSDHPWSDSDD
ncbi:uncharacterized protein PAE49_003089 isoform 1-T2 [Odontesthes bonariensis]|uniref:uncharacterized protein LOC142377892 n=1 Tax=Odontesthes bonariensis TaxID=219752 RepID=UPI003F5832AC